MKNILSTMCICVSLLACQVTKDSKLKIASCTWDSKPIPQLTFFDSTNIIHSVLLVNDCEHFVIWFYKTGAIRGVERGISIDDATEFDKITLNRYNSIVAMQYPDSYVSATFWDEYYPSGAVKTKLIPSSKTFSTFNFEEYFENGKKKSVRTFTHFSLDSLFTPVGTWIEYDSSGTQIKEYPCPKVFVQDDYFLLDK